jgi:hypothetical protein
MTFKETKIMQNYIEFEMMSTHIGKTIGRLLAFYAPRSNKDKRLRTREEEGSFTLWIGGSTSTNDDRGDKRSTQC